MSPRDAADLEWPLSEGMKVSALPPVWIAMIISCWNVKLLKLPSVTLTHVCGTNSHNWWAKRLPGVGVVKIFYDSHSDSSGWKSFRLRLLDSDSAALLGTAKTAEDIQTGAPEEGDRWPVSSDQGQIWLIRGPRLIHLWGPSRTVTRKNGKTLYSLSLAENDDVDALKKSTVNKKF